MHQDQEVVIPSGHLFLNGILNVPKQAKGIILFVHGSGSSRFSTRNQHVAHLLNDAGFATLLFDLLTPEEDEIDERTSQFRFDIPLLANRLIDVTHWCENEFAARPLPIGYFGASTGAAAALIAAAQLPDAIKAVVSRGGRADLAAAYLPQVKAPTLLIVGGADDIVIELNEEALRQLKCTHQLDIIPDATHLFEEPGALDEVSRLAKEWFEKNF